MKIGILTSGGDYPGLNAVIRGAYWGTMVALKGTDIQHVGFQEALGQLKTVPQKRYDEAAVLFG